jgi:hypothetical protein
MVGLESSILGLDGWHQLRHDGTLRSVCDLIGGGAVLEVCNGLLPSNKSHQIILHDQYLHLFLRCSALGHAQEGSPWDQDYAISQSSSFANASSPLLANLGEPVCSSSRELS